VCFLSPESRPLQGGIQGRGGTIAPQIRQKYRGLEAERCRDTSFMPHSKGGRTQHGGQALAEFALILPVFMLILGAVIQFGILFWGQNTLNQIVRDAGRYAATVPDCSAAAKADIVAKTQEIAAQANLAGTVGAITVTLPETGSDPTCPPASNAEVVWLSISVHADVPVFFPLVGGGIDSSARFRMEPQTN
jgi:hypothetical protein